MQKPENIGTYFNNKYFFLKKNTLFEPFFLKNNFIIIYYNIFNLKFHDKRKNDRFLKFNIFKMKNYLKINHIISLKNLKLKNLKYKKYLHLNKIYTKMLFNRLKSLSKTITRLKIKKFKNKFVKIKFIKKKKRHFFKKLDKSKGSNFYSSLKFFKELKNSLFYNFFYFLKIKKFKKINIFDLFFYFKNKLHYRYIRNKIYYSVRMTRKFNNTYLTLINNKGEVIFNYWTGKIFDRIIERLKNLHNLKSIQYPLSKKQKKKLKKLSKRIEKPIVSNKKWRRLRGLIKDLIRYFIKSLVEYRIFSIKSIQVVHKRKGRRLAQKLLRAFSSRNIKVEKIVFISTKSHNNGKNIKFKKPKRK